MTKKAKYLTYIEETKKHHSLIEEIAKKSVKNAIKNTQNKLVDVTYLQGGKIVVEKPNGLITLVQQLPLKQRKVQIGEKTRI